MSSVLKILTDKPCKIYCDFEFKGETKENSIFRLELKKGTYILEFIRIISDDELQVDKECKISQEYIMLSNDEEDLLRISLYDYVRYFEGDTKKAYCAVRKESKWAIADSRTLNLISEFKYDHVYYYSEKEAEISQFVDGRLLFGLFSVSEKTESVECKYLRSRSDSCDWVEVYDRSLKKVGVVDKNTNEVVVPFVYEFIYFFSGKKSSCFIVGKNIIPDSITPDSKSVKGLFAIANTKMELITPYIYEMIDVSDGYVIYLFINQNLNQNMGDMGLLGKDENIQYLAPFIGYSDVRGLTNVKKVFSNLTLFLDVETTGLPLKEDARYDELDNWPHIVQIGFILYDDNYGKLSERSIIVKPDYYRIPSSSTIIHGITHDFAITNGEDRYDVLSYMDMILSSVDIVVGHNIGFDLKTLKCEIIREKGMKGARCIYLPRKIIDTMSIGMHVCKIPTNKIGEFYKWPTLNELYTELFNKRFRGQHDALNDIIATRDCYFEMKDRSYVLNALEDEVEQPIIYPEPSFMDDSLEED